MPPIVRGLLPVVLIFVALGFPAAKAQTLPAADMEAMRSALAAAQAGDWSRAYAGRRDDNRPAAGENVALAGLRAAWRPRSLSRYRRVHRGEPRLAGTESPAQTCRGGPGRRIGRGRCRVVQALSAGKPNRKGPRSRDDDEFRRSRRRRRGLAGHLDSRRFRPSRREEFSRPPFRLASARGSCQRIDRLLWDGQSEAAHRMLGNLPPDYRLLAEARLALSAQAANAEALVARVPAQLRSILGSSSSSCAGGAKRT